MTPVDSLFSPFAGHFPNDALASEFAVELWINAVAALINIEAFTALPTEPCFMLLTIGDGFPLWMVFAFHFLFPSAQSYLKNPLPVKGPFRYCLNSIDSKVLLAIKWTGKKREGWQPLY